MKASEIVKALQVAIAQHGDLDVCTYDTDAMEAWLWPEVSHEEVYVGYSGQRLPALVVNWRYTRNPEDRAASERRRKIGEAVRALYERGQASVGDDVRLLIDDEPVVVRVTGKPVNPGGWPVWEEVGGGW